LTVELRILLLDVLRDSICLMLQDLARLHILDVMVDIGVNDLIVERQALVDDL